MINNYSVIKNSDVGIIETFYEDWESTLIYKSRCECYLPKKNKVVENIHCKFEDRYGNLVADLVLPNNLMYSLYNSQQGISIVNDEKAILRGWEKFDTSCYLLKENKLLWKSKVSKVSDIFIYEDKIYAYCSTTKDELFLLSLDTGDVIKKMLFHKSDIESFHMHRLSNRFLVGYNMGFIFVFDMLTDELKMSPMYINQPSKYFWLCKIIPCGEKKVTFRYKELNYSKGEIYFSDQEININDLVLKSERCSFQKIIPTLRVELEQEYKRLFNIII